MLLSRKKVTALVDARIAEVEKRVASRFDATNEAFGQIVKRSDDTLSSRLRQMELEIEAMKNRQIAREVEETKAKLKKKKKATR